MLVGCKEDDNPCESYYGGVNHFKIFEFDLADKTTGENLFSNGTLSIDDILCYDENNTAVPFYIYNGTTRTFITYGFPKLGISTYTLKVSSDIEILIEFDIIEIEDECRTYKTANYFKVLNYEYKKLENDYFCQIFIE